jgi:THO complex subunit 4
MDREWVHDRFEEHTSRERGARRGRQDQEPSRSQTTKLRVENVHWSLRVEDLEELFSRIGPIVKVDLEYDRAGRSEGIAYVIYESAADAENAIREYDGANAKGQPIRLSEVTSRTVSRRNPFEYAPRPGRSLADRVTGSRDRSRSRSPPTYSAEEAVRKGIDRYIPGQNRPRSPMRNRPQGGRRPGARRDAPARDREDSRGGRARSGREGRSRKTQEELDAEMDNYFGGDTKAQPSTALAVTSTTAPGAGDIDMIE